MPMVRTHYFLSWHASSRREARQHSGCQSQVTIAAPLGPTSVTDLPKEVSQQEGPAVGGGEGREVLAVAAQDGALSLEEVAGLGVELLQYALLIGFAWDDAHDGRNDGICLMG